MEITIDDVQQYMNSINVPDIYKPGNSIGRNYQETENIRRFTIRCTNIFSEVLWSLIRRGILSPGVNRNGNFYNSSIRSVDEGYTITTYGQEWLSKTKDEDLLPADPNRLIKIYDNFQLLFGKDYFRRAKEAVGCYFSTNYLACCVMCGAASESILLSVGYALEDKKLILKEYKASGGRTRIENRIFGKTRKEIQQRYKRYTDLINYWRDESGHGEESEIDVDEACIAMITLLRCAEFMRDHFDEITNK